MLGRFARAIAGGVAVAIVLQEGLWLALDPIDPVRSLHLQWTLGPRGEGWAVPLIASWLIGGSAGGLMAALVGRGRWYGHAVGALLCASAWLLLSLAWQDSGAAALLALTPGLGAAIGAGLAGRLLPTAGDAATGGVDTLRAAP